MKLFQRERLESESHLLLGEAQGLLIRLCAFSEVPPDLRLEVARHRERVEQVYDELRKL